MASAGKGVRGPGETAANRLSPPIPRHPLTVPPVPPVPGIFVCSKFAGAVPRPSGTSSRAASWPAAWRHI